MLAEEVVDDLADVHSLESLIESVLILDPNGIVEELLLPFPLLPTRMAHHLHNRGPLEQRPDEMLVRAALELMFQTVEEIAQELGGVLLDERIDGRVEALQEVLGKEVLSLGEEQIG